MTYACRYCEQVFGGPRSRQDHEIEVHQNEGIEMEARMDKPTIGRVVHYVGTLHAPENHYPAIVTHVHSDTCVNLFVFPKGAANDVPDTGLKTSVLLHDPDVPMSWHWPERG
jgi:hypothetical protein